MTLALPGPSLRLTLVALLLGGCAGAVETPPRLAMEPAVTVSGSPVDGAPAIDVQPELEPEPEPEPEPVRVEPPLQERWQSPFAVSSAGRVSPAQPRPVAVIGADPVIAEGIARLRASDASDDADDARPDASGRVVVDEDAVPAVRRLTADTDDEERLPARPGTVPASSDEPDDEPSAAPREDRDGATADDNDNDNDSAGDAGQRSAPVSVSRATSTSRGRDDDGDAERVVTHVVRRGESWFRIARDYDISPQALEEANPEVNPERIRVGQRLLIPSAEDVEIVLRTHVVRAGDTLWEIARRYDVDPSELRSLNRLPSDRLRPGQSLRIPPTDDGS